MTIKGLFNKSKIAIAESAESASANLESTTYFDSKIQDNQAFVPFLDFSNPDLFVKFGSAELYYTTAIERIYNTYPYDGSHSEQIQFDLSSSYIEQWLYDNRYPKTTGYINFSSNGWGTQASTADGFGLPDDLEYISAFGGLHIATDGMQEGELYKNFDKSTKYDSEQNQTQNFRINPVSGSTIEFWLKKDAFDVTKTEKEVIIDLWNDEAIASADYGRLTIYMTGSGVGDSGASPFRASLRNGAQGFDDQSLASSTFTTSSIIDSSWHHYAVSFLSQATGVKTYFYVDGVLENETLLGSGSVDELYGRINARIGALQTAPRGTSAAAGSGKLSASLDEFRFWKDRRTSQEINRNWFQPVFGGSNTQPNNTALGCYYKFNEGIVGTTPPDSTILDFSGRLTNGTWTGYNTTSRNTGSCFVSASVLLAEPPDPIIYSSHPDVVSLKTEMVTSGSNYDTSNGTFLYSKMPQFIRDDDEQNDDDLKKLFQVISSYFDTLYSQINVLPQLTQINYLSSSNKPLPFADRLLESRGFTTSELFVDTEVLEFYNDYDTNNIKFTENVANIKNLIYHNIYNNLDYILKSKGTEKSMRNLLRCFGIDDELVKLNLYTDQGIHYFNDAYKDSSVTKKYINFNNPAYFTSTIYQTSSVNNVNTYISGSGMAGSTQKLERYNALTFEVDAYIPEKIDVTEPGFFNTLFLSSSIGGFHQPAVETEGFQYQWETNRPANIQIYLVKDEINSERARFLLTNEDGTLFLSSSYYSDIYSNNAWNLSVRVAPDGYGIIGNAVTSSNPNYQVSFYGVNYQFGEIREQFSLTSSLSFVEGSVLVCNPKTVYVGAHYQDFTGTLLNESDVQIGGCRYWFDNLSDSDLNAHALDITNAGVDNAMRNGTMFSYDLTPMLLPRADMLALYWDFDTVTSSSAAGNFDVYDLTSGSTVPTYGWIDNIVEKEHPAKGASFGPSQTTFVENELIYTSKKELPEISVAGDQIFIKGDYQEFFIVDEDVSDSFYSLEKSMYQIISEQMLSMFASAVEFNNLIGEATDRYRHRYVGLDKMRELFFERVELDMDFDKFTNYYKWIDSAISQMMNQLYPFSARHSDSIADVVESHILERNKYQNKFPLTTTLQSTEGSMIGVSELDYNWKFGHAPIPFSASENCLWQNQRSGSRTPSDSQRILEIATNFNNATPPQLAQEDGTFYTGSTYAINRLAKPYKLGIAFNDAVHGGTNYDKIKDRDFVYSTTQIHGPVSKESPRGVPQNVLVTGVGEGQGTEPFIDCDDVINPNEKRKWRFTAVAGRFATRGVVPQSEEGLDYQFKVKSAAYWPANLISGTIEGGYHDLVTTKFKSGSIITNLHSDTFSPTNEIGLQSPFTDAWVGGHQSRHVDLNKYDVLQAPDWTKATGLISLGGATPSEDETITISDGTTSVVFTFKNTPSADNEVEIDGGATYESLITAINDYPSFTITATNEGSPALSLLNNTPGTIGNVTITETMADASNTVSGMAGGTDNTVAQTTPNGLDAWDTRPEAWRLLLKECLSANTTQGAITGSNDGAMGFVGPDYGGPYPDYNRKYAFRYREERTKRPVNLRNIQSTTASAVLGNYTENYEIISTFGMKGNSPVLREATGSLLPSHISGLLPATTNYQTLIAQTTSSIGNIFGDAETVGSPEGAFPTATIRVFYNPLDGDTITVGDGAETPITYTFKNTVVTPATQIQIQNLSTSGTRTNIKIIIEADFNITVDISLANLTLTNNVRGTAGNYTLAETFTSPSNYVSGFTGGTSAVFPYTENSRQYKIQAVEAIIGQTASLGYAFEVPPFDVVPTGSILSIPDTDSSPLTTFEIDAAGSDYQVNTNGSNTDFFNNLQTALVTTSGLYSAAPYTTTGGDVSTSLRIRSPLAAALYAQDLAVDNVYPIASATNSDSFGWAGWIWIGTGTSGIERTVWDLTDNTTNKQKAAVLFSSDMRTLRIQYAGVNTAGVYNARYWDYQPANPYWIGTYNDQWVHLSVEFTTGSIPTADTVSLSINGVSASFSTYPSFVGIGSHYSCSADTSLSIGQNGQTGNTSVKKQFSGSFDEWIWATGSFIRESEDNDNSVYNYGYQWSTTGSMSASNIAAYWKMGGTGAAGTDVTSATATRIYDQLGNGFNITGGVDTGNTPLSFTSSIDGVYGGIQTPTLAIYSLTASAAGAGYNAAIAANSDSFTLSGISYATSFINLGTVSGGVTPVSAKPEIGNIIEIQRDDLTSSNSIIRTRFSAPGGPEINTRGYLDIGSQEFSVYNALPWRNLTVLGSGSGEATTIRVNSQEGKREGMATHLTRHCGRFGVDSQWGAVQTDSYDTFASAEKVNRNARIIPSAISRNLNTKNYDNGFVSRPIPSQDYGYSWVTASLSHQLNPSTLVDSSDAPTATIRILSNPSDGDTITIGDGYVTPITYTFRTTPTLLNDIDIGANPTTARNELAERIEVDFNIAVRRVSTYLYLTNYSNGVAGNYTLSETMGGVGNTVSGFTGGKQVLQQLVFGYWPANGMLSESADVSWRDNGFYNAVNFPSGSTTYIGAVGATATVTMPTQPSDSDTCTIGDGINANIVYEFITVVSSPATQILIGSDVDETRQTFSDRIETDFNITSTIVGITVHLQNNNMGPIGDETLSETFTAGDNVVTGFTGGSKAEGLIGVYS